MVRKIFKTGNSLVISLPKESLERLGLNEGSSVVVELDQKGRKLIMSPLQQALPGVTEEFAQQVTEFIEEYREALDALAKS